MSLVSEYDPLNDRWTQKSAIPSNRSSLSAVAVGGQVLVLGGDSLPGVGGLATVEQYAPLSDLWTSLPGMPTNKRNETFAAVLQDSLFVLGGYDFWGVQAVSLTVPNGFSLTDEFDGLAVDPNWWNQYVTGFNNSAIEQRSGKLRLINGAGIITVAGYTQYSVRGRMNTSNRFHIVLRTDGVTYDPHWQTPASGVAVRFDPEIQKILLVNLSTGATLAEQPIALGNGEYNFLVVDSGEEIAVSLGSPLQPVVSVKTLYGGGHRIGFFGREQAAPWGPTHVSEMEFVTISSPVPAALSDGLVAHYPFNGNANDASGNGNNGAVRGAVLTSDRFGIPSRSYSFDGVSSKISIEKPVLNLGQEGYTISFWFKINDLSKSRQELLLTRTPMPTGQGIPGLALVFNDPAAPMAIAYYLGVGGPEGGQWTLSAQHGARTNYQGNTWYHLLFEKSGADYRLWINGTLEHSLHYPNSFNYAVGFNLGHNDDEPDGAPWFLSGCLDDVRIYNRALSDSEVRQLYAAEAVRVPVVPTITVQPSDIEVRLGGAARFAVSATGNSPLRYQWRFNGARIIGATSNELALGNVSALDFGEYTVEVSNDAGSVLSAPARLRLFADSDGDGLSDDYERGPHRYRIIEGSFTWKEAKADAESRGGHLATITTQSEFESLKLAGLLRNALWIGGTDEQTEGQWLWVTGEPWAYTRWNGGEPNGDRPDNPVGDHSSYLQLVGDGTIWNDCPSGFAQSYLLEIGFYTDPNNPDTDGDSFTDGDEVNVFKTSPVDSNSKPTPILKTGRFSFLQGYRFTVTGNPDTTYKVEISPDLKNWFPLVSTKMTSSSQILTDGTATNAPLYRFYRAMRSPQ